MDDSANGGNVDITCQGQCIFVWRLGRGGGLGLKWQPHRDGQRGRGFVYGLSGDLAVPGSE
jgi:hypothetical protein